MVKEPETSLLKPMDFDHLYKQVPEIKSMDLNLSTIAFDTPIDSSNMSPEIWSNIAGIVANNYEKHDGFVILHGSDTMAFTASALSYMLENLGKPVILTGSQLPIGVLRTDGKENFITAIEIASAYHNDKPIVPEVAVYFEYQLFRGNRVHKYNAEHFDAFRSPNYPALAEAGVNIYYDKNAIAKLPTKSFKLHQNLDSNIAILKLFPGINNNTIKSILSIKGLKGIVLESYGSGNVPLNNSLIETLKQADEKNIIVYNVTQCNSGRVESGKYATNKELIKTGVVNGADITTEAAVTKLMFLLGQRLSVTEIKKQLTISLRGELTIK